jgi:hypothetical protein
VAWYAPSSDVDALADAMIAAASSADLCARGLRAVKIVGERFSIDTMVWLYEAVYRQLLD